MLRARDVMTKDLCWIKENKNVDEAYNVMSEYGFRHLPVVNDNNELVGVISETDILKASYGINGKSILPDKCLADIMSEDVISTEPGRPLANIVATMMACKINCVPVVLNKVPIGIITSTDILDLFCRSEEANGHSVMPIAFRDRTDVVTQSYLESVPGQRS